MDPYKPKIIFWRGGKGSAGPGEDGKKFKV